MRHSMNNLATPGNEGRKWRRYMLALLGGLIPCLATKDALAQRAVPHMQAPGMMGHPMSSLGFNHMRYLPWSYPQVAGGVGPFLAFPSTGLEPGYFQEYPTGRVTVENPTKGSVRVLLHSEEGRWFLNVPAGEYRWINVPIGIYNPRFKFSNAPTILQGDRLTLMKGSNLTIRLEQSGNGNYPLRPVPAKSQRVSKKARK